MINTVNTKQQQLVNGFYRIGNGGDNILIVGSCRAVPYMNYLNTWNRQNGEKFSLFFIDPYNFCYDTQDNRVDMQGVIESLELNDAMLKMLKSIDIVIHEFYSNFGMFNFDKKAEKNIYQFGLNPIFDICLPNWNDKFVLFGDIVTFDTDIRKKAIADVNVTGKISIETQKEIFELSQKNVEKFYSVCRMSDIPEMEEYYESNYKQKRFAWNSNHVSKHFTLAVWRFINDKYLKLPLTDFYWEVISEEDMYANNYTHLTPEDILWHGYKWGEPTVPLKSKIM